MITLSSVINQFEADFLSVYRNQLLPSQIKALNALKICRTQDSPVMRVDCTCCDHRVFVPQEVNCR